MPFIQEFHIMWTAVLVLGTDFLTRNEITFDSVKGVLTWKPCVGAAKVCLTSSRISDKTMNNLQQDLQRLQTTSANNSTTNNNGSPTDYRYSYFEEI